MLNLKSLFSFFTKNEPIPIIEKVKLELTVTDFNKWFCEIYDGYDGRVGNKGIFGRTDKLSGSMIEDYLEYIGFTLTSREESLISMSFEKEVRKNWNNR